MYIFYSVWVCKKELYLVYVKYSLVYCRFKILVWYTSAFCIYLVFCIYLFGCIIFSLIVYSSGLCLILCYILIFIRVQKCWVNHIFLPISNVFVTASKNLSGATYEKYLINWPNFQIYFYLYIPSYIYLDYAAQFW